MNEKRVKRGLKAILSADVKGYSRLMEDDDEATVNTIKAHRTMMADLIVSGVLPPGTYPLDCCGFRLVKHGWIGVSDETGYRRQPGAARSGAGQPRLQRDGRSGRVSAAQSLDA